jgi:hypothetical protein
MAKTSCATRAVRPFRSYFDLGLMAPESKKSLEADPFAYGVRANRKVLEAIAQFSFEQGRTPRLLKLEEVFHPATLDL